MSECFVEREHGAPAELPLRRNRRFQALWIGAAAANLGLETVEVACPLLVLGMTGSPALAGLFGFTEVGTAILAGLPAGVVVDRLDRRRVLLVSEAVRALALTLVVGCLEAGVANLGLLLGAAVALGTATAFGAPARMLLLRAVVPDHQLTAALSRDEARGGAAALAGPPLGGALYLASRAFPFAAAALGFAVSFCCALAVRVPAADPADPAAGPGAAAPPAARPARAARPAAEALAGLREVAGDRLLRAALAVICGFYFSVTAAVLVVVVALRHQHHSSGAIGLALTGTAVGMLAGAMLVPRLDRRLGPGTVLLAASALTAAGVGLLALPLGPVWVFAMLALAALGLPALRILVDILVFRRTPDHRRGRTIAATMTLIGAGAPLGSLVAGLALQLLGVTGAVVLVAGVQAAVTAAGLRNRHVTAARWPR
ncbi:MFS transporter [Streptomyces sp. NRRL F-5123]|uniref:MFS transporter n=1 Tax=Streptomyces sp. NRRL F-5123 TaxID=1463856 RepID=UPI0004E0D282|nr:MFS transporter [Streptomyces sp. NRRL F-5123]